MKNLENRLKQLDGKSYRSLKSIEGTYRNDFLTLHIDYVQGDPFASPSRVRLFIPMNNLEITSSQFDSPHRAVALQHFFAKMCQKMIYSIPNPVKGTGKSGQIYIDCPGQEVLDRTAVKIDKNGLEIRLSVGLPAQGRRILGHAATTLLTAVIPKIGQLLISQYDRNQLERALLLADDQQDIRTQLKDSPFVAFVANGAILPRESGVSNKPLKGNHVIPFQTPSSYHLKLTLASGKTVEGMGIKKGITLIIGGGYHGKSTLLQAIERGVYNHERGDGREYVITDDTAMKIRSEDGRAINQVDVSSFINNLPFGKQTDCFSSDDASGSTSQAANIMESIEMNTKLLLIDEDTSATNFMIRDGRMQLLVQKAKEPITPFIDRVRDLYEQKSISTILVIGGSGDYFDVADHVIMMDEYAPIDKTAEVKNLTDHVKSTRTKETVASINIGKQRRIQKRKILNLFDYKEKIDAKGMHTIRIGKSSLELNEVEQIVDSSQTQAIALIIKIIVKDANGSEELKIAIDDIYTKIAKDGLDSLSPFKGKHPGDFAMPRKLEIAAAFNRIRI